MVPAKCLVRLPVLVLLFRVAAKASPETRREVPVRGLPTLQQVGSTLSSFPQKVGSLQKVLVSSILQNVHNEVLEEQLLAVSSGCPVDFGGGPGMTVPSLAAGGGESSLSTACLADLVLRGGSSVNGPSGDCPFGRGGLSM